MSIMYQPQSKDFKNPNWEKQFQALNKFGFKTIVIQWTSYGKYNFLNEHPLWIQNFLRLADKYNLQIIFGLYSDPSYFQEIKKEGILLRKYLLSLSQKHIQMATSLSMFIKDNSTFKGWYICDEIDDMHWRSKKRQIELETYLKVLNKELTKLTGEKEIMISAFFSKQMEPSEYGRIFRRTIPEGWHLLLQSGVGAGLVDVNESKIYLDKFDKTYQGTWSPIIELFSYKEKEFQADFSLYRRQKEYLNIQKSTLFSWRYFFDEDFQQFYKK